MLRSALFFGLIVAASGADNWAKVRELKSGSELRILKRNARQPTLAKMDEASEERLVVVIGDEQIGIAKDEIERIDFRPASGSRVKAENRTTTVQPEKVPAGTRPSRPHVPSTSSTSGLSFGSKPPFEMVYRRSQGGVAQ